MVPDHLDLWYQITEENNLSLSNWSLLINLLHFPSLANNSWKISKEIFEGYWSAIFTWMDGFLAECPSCYRANQC